MQGLRERKRRKERERERRKRTWKKGSQGERRVEMKEGKEFKIEKNR